MNREELLRQRRNVIYVLLAVFAIGFFATFFIMDIPNIYFSENYAIKINGEQSGRGLGLYKRMFSNDVYMYAGSCKEFHPGIAVEAISIDRETIKVDSGYCTKYIKNKATITVRNTITGERYNIRGAASSVEDTVPYVNVADAISVMGYRYNLSSIKKTISITTN
mgnify:CR=1 FL=1